MKMKGRTGAKVLLTFSLAMHVEFGLIGKAEF
jgi:hypothetical protein